MQRRDFLRFLHKPALAAAALPVMAAAAPNEVAMKDRSGVGALRDQVAMLKGRIDRMDRSYKRTLKLVAGLAALSLGMDISAVL